MTSTIFNITFTDLDIAWGSLGQLKAKPIGLVFSHTSQLIRMKFDAVMKQFRLNVLTLTFELALVKQGK